MSLSNRDGKLPSGIAPLELINRWMETKYLIFSNPRSGTSVLGEILRNYLETKENYPGHLYEYFSNRPPPTDQKCFELQGERIVRIRGSGVTNTSIKDRLRFLEEANKGYSFELQTWQTTPEIFNTLTKDYHFICLIRKNLLEVLLSSTIGHHLQSWNTYDWDSDRFMPKLKSLQPNDLVLEQNDRYHGYVNNHIMYHQYWLPRVSNRSIIYYEDFGNLKNVNRALHLLGFSDWKTIDKKPDSIKVPYPYPKIEYFRNKDEIRGWVRELEEKLNWPWPFQE